jgi:outer membrane protein TolC
VDASLLALEKQVSIARAGYVPVLSAFADYEYANPNERRFPPTSEWTATWDVGVRLTWSPNDAWTASANAREAVARAASLRGAEGQGARRHRAGGDASLAQRANGRPIDHLVAAGAG